MPQKSVKKSSQKYTVSIEKFFLKNSLVQTKITSKLRLFVVIKKLILSYFFYNFILFMLRPYFIYRTSVP